jgi:hypothetical protein
LVNNNNLFSKTENVLTRKIFNVEIFYIVCCLLAMIKIWLISGDEIIAKANPHDQLWHILAATRGYWFGNQYDYLTFVHLPMYALWIKLISITGIPLRIVTELLFLLAGYTLILALFRSGISKFVCILCYAMIIFHPFSFYFFNETWSETLYMPLLLLALASAIMLWVKREDGDSIKYALLVGIFMSILWHIRKENILIILFLMLLLFLASLMSWREKKERVVIFRQLGVMVMVPFLIIISVSLAVKTANYFKFGLFVSTEMDAPGYVASYRALQRIEPSPSIRFIPVTKKTRLSAYSVSPSFQEMAPLLENELYGFTIQTNKEMGIPHEIAGGWFYWALRDAANISGHHNTAREANVYYQRIADEINRAIDDGRLPGRLVFLTFMDPDLSNYVSYLPDSLLRMWRFLIPTAEKPAIEKDDLRVAPGVRETYNRVANRRPALASYDITTIRGWFIPESGRIKQVSVRAENGEMLAVTDLIYSRTDIVKFFEAQGIKNIPAATGFDLTITSKNRYATHLDFITDDNKYAIIPLNNLEIDKFKRTTTTDFARKIVYSIDTLSQQKAPTLRDAMQGFIWSIYGKIVVCLSLICFLAGFMLLIVHRSIDYKENIYPILCILLFIVLSRVAFFALLDASSWPGGPRYLFPVMPVYSCFLLIFIDQAVKVVELWYTTKSSR